MDTYLKIKQTLNNSSGSCVVLRKGDPYCVVMTWQEYEKFANIINDNKKLKNGREKIGNGVDINSIPV
ncbi:MAG TPA: hypothetical protein ENH26_01465 [Candidatus Wolfebacteria bacterium]|nr:hypothetical protein [Candidatus Wolfebacteria bacterium]